MIQQHSSVPRSAILRRRDVQSRTGLSKSSLYRSTKEGTFPAPVRIGPRCVGWIEAEVQAWIERRIEISRRPQESITSDSTSPRRYK
jgi:prophage regulatory protein